VFLSFSFVCFVCFVRQARNRTTRGGLIHSPIVFPTNPTRATGVVSSIVSPLCTTVVVPCVVPGRLIEVVGPSLLGIVSDFTRVPAKFPGVTQEDRDMNFQLWLKEKKEMSKLAKAEQDSGALGWAQKEEEELRDTQGLTPKVKNITELVGVFVEGWCLFVPGTCIDVVYNFDPDRNGEAILLCRKKFKIW